MKPFRLAFFVFILLSHSILAQTPRYVPKDGLKGLWLFDGNANDLSTNGKNGAVIGARLSTDRFDNLNSAYSFNGLDNYIEVDSLNLESFSFSLWIKSDSINPNNLNGLISNLSDVIGSPYVGYEFRINHDSTLMLVCGQGSSWLQPKTTLRLINDRWYHLVASSDNDSVKIYIDTKNIASYPITKLVDNDSKVLFGTRNPNVANGGSYTGKIDDIGIWDRALNQNEIDDLYNGNICFKNVTIHDTLTTQVTDTTYITETVYDTLTTQVTDTIYITETVYDTVFYSVADTLIIHLFPLQIENSTLKDRISLFPNPTQNVLHAKFNNIEILNGYTIKILDSTGKEVYSKAVDIEQLSINMMSWGSKGIYFFILYDSNNVPLVTKKILLN